MCTGFLVAQCISLFGAASKLAEVYCVFGMVPPEAAVIFNKDRK